MIPAKRATERTGVADSDALLRMIYTPNDVATYTLDAVQDRQDHPGLGLQTNLHSLDKWLMPLMPGELVVVLGRPSNYKSGFLSYWARQVVAQILAWGEAPEGKPQPVVVYASWEMLVEELGLYDLVGRSGVDMRQAWFGSLEEGGMDRLRGAAMKRAVCPIWMIGHSLARRKDFRNLTLPGVREALLRAEDVWQVRPAILFLDYLQTIEAVDGEDKRMQVMSNVEWSKRLARDLGCPVVLAAQAGREVDERAFKLPGMGDSQESSRIEQAADKLIALWMPKITEELGSRIDALGGLEVTENLLVAGVRKQRMGPAGQVVALHVVPETNDIYDLERAPDSQPEARAGRDGAVDDGDGIERIPF
jgi:replicative DNA helicase